MREKVLAASAGRDRVVDAVKALALMLVVLGHALAWTLLPNGQVVNTLEQAPALFPLTWVLQILPLFFLLAGAGLVRYASTPSTAGLWRRVDRLASPAVLLLAVAMGLSAVVTSVAGRQAGAAAGVLAVQLTWFLGVYLIVVALAPLLVRCRAWWHFAVFAAAVAGVDVLRVTVGQAWGWVNLVVVWSFFAAAGMRLSQLRDLPRRAVAAGALLSAGLAVAAVVWGPYSPALITTAALPGLSNLAPPTVVLLLAGTCQVCLLLLAWPYAARLLARDGVWVPVAVFSARAMGVYLWHMLVLAACVGAAMALRAAPEALSASWWGLHLLALAVVVGVVWLAAPALLKAADGAVSAVARCVPSSLGRWVSGLPVLAVCGVAVLSGVAFLLVSESGVGDAWGLRTVVGLPYVPLAAVGLLVVVCAVARRASRS